MTVTDPLCIPFSSTKIFHANAAAETIPDHIEITPASADQIVGLTDLPGNVAGLTETCAALLLRVKELEASNRCRLDENLGCHNRIAALEQRVGQLDGTAHTHSGYSSVLTTTGPAQTLEASPPWPEPLPPATTTQEQTKRDWRFREAMDPHTVEQRVIAQRVVIQTADERDAAHADADALAHVLCECRKTLSDIVHIGENWSALTRPLDQIVMRCRANQVSIEAALAKHGGGK